MPDEIPDGESSSGYAAGCSLVRLTHAETSLFPGAWEPLHNERRVKIISMQKTDESSKDGSEPEAGIRKIREGISHPGLGRARVSTRSVKLPRIYLRFSACGHLLVITKFTALAWPPPTVTDFSQVFGSEKIGRSTLRSVRTS